jgi:hypothetical protein
MLDEKCLLIHYLKNWKSHAKFYLGIFQEIDSELKEGV